MDKYDFWKYNFCPFMKIVVIVILIGTHYTFNTQFSFRESFLVFGAYFVRCVFVLCDFCDFFLRQDLQNIKSGIKCLENSFFKSIFNCDMNTSETQPHSVGGNDFVDFFTLLFFLCGCGVFLERMIFLWWNLIAYKFERLHTFWW